MLALSITSLSHDEYQVNRHRRLPPLLKGGNPALYRLSSWCVKACRWTGSYNGRWLLKTGAENAVSPLKSKFPFILEAGNPRG
jgi:hypothetical protein